MDIYNKRRRWKLIILFLATTISLFSLYYTNYIVGELKIEERKKMELYAYALKKLAEINNLEADMSLVTEILTHNTTIPLILTNKNDSILAFVNFNESKAKNKLFMIQELHKIKESREPIIIYLTNHEEQRVYYKDSTVLIYLFWYPIVQILVFALFVFVAYIAFSNSRKAEQNRVWIGMSKETAHQLGTPISSLLAWIELLKNYPEIDKMIPEMQKDIERLDTIARRFSKIGSTPELKKEPIVAILKNAVNYMQYRTSAKIIFTLNVEINEDLTAMINKSLFEWVVENIIRNAVDAMQGQGAIGINAGIIGQNIIIDFSDTGKGIPKRKQKTIFAPGFTTKQRGWGLGLSLSKRIVENYHAGKIYVKNSELNKGSTIRITIPI